MKSFFVVLLFALVARGQTPAGVSAEWDIAKSLNALSAQAARLQPILNQLAPEEWVSQGAPETYVEQKRAASDELQYLAGAVADLQSEPGRLTLALAVYFRLQALETQMLSLVDGVRKYQNPAVGDLVVSVLGENASNRDGLRQYITELAADKELEFKVVDQEAQRCRGALSRQPAPAPARKKAAPNTQ